jgi:hypothetical protein
LLVPFVIVGLLSMSGEIVFALACAFALFAAYLTYGHWVHWTLYYFEGLPVLAAITAVGIWKTLMRIRAMPVARLSALAVALLAMVAAYDLRAERSLRVDETEWDRGFRDLVSRLPLPAAVIFVHYDPAGISQPSVVTNSPHLDEDAVWIVNDLGARNKELMKYAGPRVPFNFYVATSKIELAPDLVPPPSPK